MAREAGGIRFEIDESPLSLHSRTSLDYLGAMLRGALSEPIIVNPGNVEAISRTEAEAIISSSADGLEYSIFIGGGRCWSNGRILCANDYAGRLIQLTKHPFWCRHLAYVKRIEVLKPNVLAITLRERLNYFPTLLSTICFAPERPYGSDTRSSRWRCTNGPFYLDSYRRGEFYRLKPNRHHSSGGSRPSIEFFVNRDYQCSTALFSAGKSDVSSNTSLTVSDISYWKGKPEFYSDNSPIYFALEFHQRGHICLRSTDFRIALFQALDRTKISADLNGVVAESNTIGPVCFADSFPPLAYKYDYPAATRILSAVSKVSRPLRIAYWDYPPNKEIVEAIQEQWKRVLGLCTQSYPVPFVSAIDQSYDMILTLRVPAYNHAYSVLEIYSSMYRQFADHRSWKAFEDTLLRVRSGPGAKVPDATRHAGGHLAAQMVTLPLFTGKNNYLRSRRITGFSFPQTLRFDFSRIRCD